MYVVVNILLSFQNKNEYPKQNVGNFKGRFCYDLEVHFLTSLGKPVDRN